MLPFELTKDTPYLALSGELWSVFYEYFNKNWPCYKGFLLYSLQIIRWYIWPQPGRNPALACFRPDSDTSSGDVDRGSHTLGLTLSKWTEYSSGVWSVNIAWCHLTVACHDPEMICWTKAHLIPETILEQYSLKPEKQWLSPLWRQGWDEAPFKTPVGQHFLNTFLLLEFDGNLISMAAPIAWYNILPMPPHQSCRTMCKISWLSLHQNLEFAIEIGVRLWDGRTLHMRRERGAHTRYHKRNLDCLLDSSKYVDQHFWKIHVVWWKQQMRKRENIVQTDAKYVNKISN